MQKISCMRRKRFRFWLTTIYVFYVIPMSQDLLSTSLWSTNGGWIIKDSERNAKNAKWAIFSKTARHDYQCEVKLVSWNWRLEINSLNAWPTRM